MSFVNERNYENPEAIDPFLLSCQAEELSAYFNSPTLVTIPGQIPEVVFISVLLHGNETTGFYALQNILRQFQEDSKRPRRTLVLFFGNVAACAENLRKLPVGEDFNRIWDQHSSWEGSLVQDVLKKVVSQNVVVAVDVHNNTGQNPIYSCVAQTDPQTMALAKKFADTSIQICGPEGAHVVQFSKHVPALTLECGTSGDETGLKYAQSFCEHLLFAGQLFVENSSSEFSFFTTCARVCVPHGCCVSFDKETCADFVFSHDVEDLNFHRTVEPTVIGKRYTDKTLEISLTGDMKPSRFIEYRGDDIVLMPGYTPSMFTTLIQNVMDDCLFYLMVG